MSFVQSHFDELKCIFIRNGLATPRATLLLTPLGRPHHSGFNPFFQTSPTDMPRTTFFHVDEIFLRFKTNEAFVPRAGAFTAPLGLLSGGRFILPRCEHAWGLTAFVVRVCVATLASPAPLSVLISPHRPNQVWSVSKWADADGSPMTT